MSNPSIHFQLSFPAPQTHYVEVLMTIRNIDSDNSIDLKMPVWAPGSYLVREYSKNVERFSAETIDQEPIEAIKINKNTWRVYNLGKDLAIRYAVYGFETSVRTSFIDQDRAFLSPVGTFLYVDKRIDLPCTVQINLPNNWSKISTGLPKVESESIFIAENFDILFDSPFEIGNQDTWQFDVDGIIHECAMVGIADYDKNQLSKDIAKIVQEENKIWKSNPNNYYLIVTHNHHQSHGGLEHLNSTILSTSRFAYSQPSSYKSYLSLVAHEYFHLWNVKRFRPKALGPFNYDQENYTTGLWLMEGITSYYDNLIIRRCGFYDEQEYLQQLANEFNTVYNRPGHKLQSAAQSSFDTWIKHYRPDENSQNVTISYYNKGAIHSLMLDLKILVETKGKYRLDDVLRQAYEQFYLIENRGFDETELLEFAEKLTEVSLKDIFDAAYSTEDMNYNFYLNAVGYELKDINESNHSLALGIKTSYQEGKTTIKHVDRDSGAWFGGLNVNDELLAINQYRVDEHNKIIDYISAKAKEGDLASILISRDGIVKRLEIPFNRLDKKSFVIQRKVNANDEERSLGNIWLSI